MKGGIYDDRARIYGVTIENNIPRIYELMKMKARSWGTQMFPINVNNEGYIYTYDSEKQRMHNFKLSEV